jgi:hypothetical protein
MYNTFFLGIYPGISKEEINYMADSIDSFLKSA